MGEKRFGVMSNQVVSVRRDKIVACMTCPLCNKLLRDATTISECLHTFCRKCIYKKLSDEEFECCPVCNTNLGCVPLDKLRHDHNLQDVRAKIFPFKRRKVNAPEVPSITLPVRRKERSLSSLVVSTPRVLAQTATTRRKSKVSARKTSRGPSSSPGKHIKKEEDSIENHPESSSSQETLTKFTQNIRQNSSTVEPSSHPVPDKETENGSETWEGKVDLWKPLNCLVDAANRSKSLKFTLQGSAVKSEALRGPGIEGCCRKTKAKEHGQKSKVQDDMNNTGPHLPESIKPKKRRRIRQEKTSAFGESGIFPQDVMDAANSRWERKVNPIWFSLVASEDQEGYVSLPQISANYLSIKDVNVPISFIQKYLMRKLDLTSEDEVEIKCMGQSVVPTLQLRNLMELWLQTASPPEKVAATIGSCAKDFVMVLAYARKVPPHPRN